MHKVDPTRPKVVIAETISQAGIDALAEHCDVDVAAGAERADLLQRLGDANGKNSSIIWYARFLVKV